MFDTDPALWISVAAMQFEGSAACWLQAVQPKISTVNWSEFCSMVLQRFGRNQHQSLIRRLYHLVQTGSVEEYIEQFADLVDQLSAYETSPDPLHYTTRFLDGLKPAVRMFVAIQRPVDLDTAYLLASLQEEVGDGLTALNTPAVHQAPARRLQHHQQRFPALMPPPAPDRPESSRVAQNAVDDKLSALRSYRRAKGMCFTCGENWARDHQCKAAVQLHVVQEMIDFFYAESIPYSYDEADDIANLMHLSAATDQSEPVNAI
jgi:hypothetical protein